MTIVRLAASSLTILLCVSLAAVPAFAQRELSGSAKAELALKRLQVTGSVLMIAAHPDDENTAVLAWLARGRKVRTGYLSLTRGEGGQNLIGTEQGDAMGLIRTEELLAARNIDGAEQFFTRAIDFGFTKTPQETFEKWGHEKILSDVVWVIRKFEPDVIILRFSGTPRDGHGQHQVSAILGKEAFLAAADPKRFPEQLKWVQPWKAKRLMWNVFAFSQEQQKEAEKLPGKLEIDTGEYDPLLGYSYREIAGMSRTMHRSQGMGSPERPGSSKEYLTVVAGEPATKDLFDGVDLTWGRVAGGEAVGRGIAKAVEAFMPDHPENAAGPLLDAKRAMSKLEGPIVERKRAELDEAIAQCAGLWVDAEADAFAFTPGSEVTIKTAEINRGPLAVSNPGTSVSGFTASEGGGVYDFAFKRNEPHNGEVKLHVPSDWPPSQPYWLVEPKQGDTYTVSDQAMIGLAENPPLMKATFSFSVGGGNISLTRPVIYRWIDRERGELTRPPAVVPSVALRVGAASLIFGSDKSRTVEVQVKGERASGSGTLRLNAPAGWRIEPAAQKFTFNEQGQETALAFHVVPPGGDSTGELQAIALLEGREVSIETKLIDYTHIPPQFYFPPAAAKLVRADIRTLAHSIGYVMGAGDEVPEALRQIGCDVTLLNADALTRGDLSRFDAIVTGVRAYNTRADLRANEDRLLEYALEGGTVVVQYNTLDGFFSSETHALDRIGPYPLKIGRERVTVEEAPVKFLEPGSPLLLQPNKITEGDFAGWIQERGLYFAHTWDSHYRPLFSVQDPGEQPLEGATLYAAYGKGAFVFTAFSWFRELPAGVPGAFRIFANLLSAGKTLPAAGTGAVNSGTSK